MNALRNLIGWFLGYGRCVRCGRSWWYAEMGDGVRLDAFGRAIVDPTAPSSSGRHALCRPCEVALTWEQRLNWDAAFVELRESGEMYR